MEEAELERTMLDFYSGKCADPDLARPLSKTGVDIPNANTMIISDSDRLGLAQLYQLRGASGGRIGRPTPI